MKRIMEESPVAGYKLFRFQGRRADGTQVVYPNYYVRHDGRDTCTETSKLSEAKVKVKKMAGEEAQERKRLASREVVTVGLLLDHLLEDYKKNEQRSIVAVRGQIKNSLRPSFGDMLAERVDSDEIERWMTWRSSRSLRRMKGRDSLQPASINRELSLLRRAYQLGYLRSVILRTAPYILTG